MGPLVGDKFHDPFGPTPKMDSGDDRTNALSNKNGSAEKSKSDNQIEKPAEFAHKIGIRKQQEGAYQANKGCSLSCIPEVSQTNC